MARSIKKQLQDSIYILLKHNKMGSHATQYMRRASLFQSAEILVAGGYKIPHINGFKQKHAHFLVQQWQSAGLSIGTIKNRLAHLRAVCDLLKRPEAMPSNDALGLPNRQYSTNIDKTEKIKDGDLTKISDHRVQVQLNLQRVFGLRHEECIKLKPFLADKIDALVLEGSWCKGGRPRSIPILTDEQRFWLKEAKMIAGQQPHSLIPTERSYAEYSRYFYRVIKEAGFNGSHGLRHHYAQMRYLELTGWQCPAKGGKTSDQLTNEQKKLDELVRLKISEELGHSREQITVNYLGR